MAGAAMGKEEDGSVRRSRFLLFVIVLPLLAMAATRPGGVWPSGTTAEASTSAATDLTVVGLTCTSGDTVRLELHWASSTTGLQWVDLTLFNNGFAPGTFLGWGPHPPGSTGLVWEGLLPGLTHYLRVNTLTPAGWFPSITIAFNTPDCLAGFSTAPQAIPGGAFGQNQAVLTEVRVGAHPDEGFDRIVFEFAGVLPDAEVEYHSQVFACGSGFPVHVNGTAVLQVTLRNAVAHNDAGQVTVNALHLNGTDDVIREAEQTCDFEGIVAWAVGTDGFAPFRVITLSGPSRLVIDIQR